MYGEGYDPVVDEIREKIEALHHFITGLSDAYERLKRKRPKTVDDYRTLNELFKTIREKYKEMARLEEELIKRTGLKRGGYA